MSSYVQPVLSWGGSSFHTELMLLSCPAQRPGVCWVPKGLEVSSLLIFHGADSVFPRGFLLTAHTITKN